MSNSTAKLTIQQHQLELPIFESTMGEYLVDIGILGKLGIYTLDPGFKATGSCFSEICYINGEEGKLSYRGYPIEQLAEKSTYLEVAYLLFHGEKPSSTELRAMADQITNNQSLPKSTQSILDCLEAKTHPMGMLLTGVSSLSYLSNTPQSAQEIDNAQIQLIAKLPTICATIIQKVKQKPLRSPRQDLSYSANFLHQISDENLDLSTDPLYVQALDVILTLHAEHEQNASTSAVRVTASTGTNTFGAIVSGIGALWGPSHGGANEACINMLQSIGHIDNIPSFIEQVKDKSTETRLMGFGHRVYKNYDPRATIIQSLCHRILEKSTGNTLFELAKKLESIARSDEYFIQRNLYPNVDFYSGIILTAMGIPESCFTLIFALARTSGWIAHIKELFTKHPHPITRPRQCYVGSKIRDF
jgi:citrate synthase